MKPLHKIALDDYRHKKNKLYIDTESGTFYYGRDERNLVHPGGLDAMGKLPPLTLTDMEAVYQAGVLAGARNQKEKRQ